eukprot:Skav226133  [mRNA]  locus=scaffold1047:356268:367460:- [translate_table: standard]
MTCLNHYQLATALQRLKLVPVVPLGEVWIGEAHGVSRNRNVVSICQLGFQPHLISAALLKASPKKQVSELPHATCLPVAHCSLRLIALLTKNTCSIALQHSLLISYKASHGLSFSDDEPAPRGPASIDLGAADVRLGGLGLCRGQSVLGGARDQEEVRRRKGGPQAVSAALPDTTAMAKGDGGGARTATRPSTRGEAAQALLAMKRLEPAAQMALPPQVATKVSARGRAGRWRAFEAASTEASRWRNVAACRELYKLAGGRVRGHSNDHKAMHAMVEDILSEGWASGASNLNRAFLDSLVAQCACAKNPDTAKIIQVAIRGETGG